MKSKLNENNFENKEEEDKQKAKKDEFGL